MTQYEFLSLCLGDEVAYCKDRWKVVEFLLLNKDKWPIIENSSGKRFAEGLYVTHLMTKLNQE